MSKKKQKDQSKELRAAYIELLSRRYEGFRDELEKTTDATKEIISREFFEKCCIYRSAVIDARSIHGDRTYPALPDISDFPEGWEGDENFVNEYEVRLKAWAYNIWEHIGLQGKLECMNFEPGNTLLVGVDLTRSKKAIMFEFEEALDKHKINVKNRLKWLPQIDEILQVWDMWEGYGQRKCFHLIARRLKIPESTVKARWRLAYKLIHGKSFTKEQGNIRADELCSTCGDQSKCYRIVNDVMTFIPCAAHRKLAGPIYSREKIFENIEKIMSKKSYEDFLQEE